jgi:hypothetical protein
MFGNVGTRLTGGSFFKNLKNTINDLPPPPQQATPVTTPSSSRGGGRPIPPGYGNQTATTTANLPNLGTSGFGGVGGIGSFFGGGGFGGVKELMDDTNPTQQPTNPYPYAPAYQPISQFSPSFGYQNLIARMQQQTPWMAMPDMNTRQPQPMRPPMNVMNNFGGMGGGGFGNMGGYGGRGGMQSGGFMSQLYNNPQMMSGGYQPQMGNPYARMGGMMQRQPQQMYGNRQFMNSMMQQRPYQRPQLGQDTLNRLNNTNMLQRGQLSNRTGMPAPPHTFNANTNPLPASLRQREGNGTMQSMQGSRGGGNFMPTALLQRQKMLQQLQQRPGTGLKFADTEPRRPDGSIDYSQYGRGLKFADGWTPQSTGGSGSYAQGGVRLPQMGGGFLGRLAPLGINYGMIA